MSIFRVGHMNVRSLINGFDNLKNYILNNNFSLFAVSETWLTGYSRTDMFSLPDYIFIRKDRDGRGGGVGFFIKKSIKYTMIKFPQSTFLEQLWLSLNIRGKTYLLGVLYRPPKYNVVSGLEALDYSLSLLMPTYDNTIIMGDLNIDLFVDNMNSHQLNNIFETYDLNQLISEPTRVTNTSSTLLDIIAISNDAIIGAINVVDVPEISDHFLTSCEINNISIDNNIKFVKYRDFKNFNEQLFVDDLNKIEWDHIFSMNDVDDMLNFFNENVLYLFDVHAPQRTVRVSKPPAPWLTNTIKEMINLRNKAFNKYKKTRLLADFNFYKDLRNYITGAIRREKRAYLDFTLDKRNSKDTWKTLRSMDIVKNKNLGKEIPNSLSDVNVINSYFINSTNIDEENVLDDKYNYQPNIEPLFTFTTTDSVNIQKFLYRIKTNSTGLDGISIKMLIIVSSYLIDHITYLINTAISTSIFPSAWKYSLILPLAKIPNPTEISHLRPISILPAMSKLLEMTMHQQISEYVSNQNIIPPIQSGFRSSHSTATALIHIADDILHNTDEDKLTCLVLLDFSKAFDTLDHNLLCKKLLFFGFDEHSTELIGNYLNHRTQRVCLKSSVSDELPVQYGVPQGSILGPLLFSIYISDFYLTASSCNIHHYADDTQLYYSFYVNDLINANKKINADLNSLLKISHEHRLKLNPNKSQVLLFGPKQKRLVVQNSLHVTLGNIELEVVNECKNLGVWFDSDLRFTKHINQLLKTCYNILKQLYPHRQVINQKLKLTLCESLIFSKLSYCDVLFGPNLLQIDKSRLQRIQNSCIRFSYGIRKFDHISHKYEDAGWLKIVDMHKYHFMCFTHKLLMSSTPSYLCNKLTKLAKFNIERSSRNKNTLLIPKHKTAAFTRSFSYLAPKLYNQLPNDFKNLSLINFKKRLKSFVSDIHF